MSESIIWDCNLKQILTKRFWPCTLGRVWKTAGIISNPYHVDNFQFKDDGAWLSILNFMKKNKTKESFILSGNTIYVKKDRENGLKVAWSIVRRSQ